MTAAPPASRSQFGPSLLPLIAAPFWPLLAGHWWLNTPLLITFQFDVEGKVSASCFTKITQRLVNYFLQTIQTDNLAWNRGRKFGSRGSNTQVSRYRKYFLLAPPWYTNIHHRFQKELRIVFSEYTHNKLLCCISLSICKSNLPCQCNGRHSWTFSMEENNSKTSSVSSETMTS